MSEDCHEVSPELNNRTAYLGRREDNGIVGSDVYSVQNKDGLRIVEVKSLTELIRHYQS